MSQETRFHAEQVDPQNAASISDALNGLLDREDVADVVDWNVIAAKRAGNLNLVARYEVAR